jgi:hypothetical protein
MAHISGLVKISLKTTLLKGCDAQPNENYPGEFSSERIASL